MNSMILCCMLTFVYEITLAMNELSCGKNINFLLRDNQGQEISVPHQVVQACKTLVNCTEDSVCDEIILPFSKEVIDEFVSFVQKEKKVYQIESLAKVWQAADFLALNHTQYANVTRYYKKSMPKGSLMRKKLNSGLNDILKIECDAIKNWYLDLSNKNLDRIEGIEHLNFKKDVLYIDLSNNNLRTLNMRNLLQLFPSMKGIAAPYNKIRKIKPTRLPDDFYLDVSHNKLQMLPKHSLDASNGFIDLSYNRLNQETMQNACLLLPLQKKLKYVSAFKKNWVNQVQQFKPFYSALTIITLSFTLMPLDQPEAADLEYVKIASWFFCFIFWFGIPLKETLKTPILPYINNKNQIIKI